jgi:SAM-dependent methyltransferase
MSRKKITLPKSRCLFALTAKRMDPSDIKDIKPFFDSFAEDYVDAIGRGLGDQTFHSNKDNPIRILSIGCGLGEEAGALSTLFKDQWVDYYGIDTDSPNIQAAQELHSKHNVHNHNPTISINFSVTNALKIDDIKRDCKGNIFDVVLLLHPDIHGVSAPRIFKEELKSDFMCIIKTAIPKLLKQNGTVVTTLFYQPEMETYRGYIEANPFLAANPTCIERGNRLNAKYIHACTRYHPVNSISASKDHVAHTADSPSADLTTTKGKTDKTLSLFFHNHPECPQKSLRQHPENALTFFVKLSKGQETQASELAKELKEKGVTAIAANTPKGIPTVSIRNYTP